MMAIAFAALAIPLATALPAAAASANYPPAYNLRNQTIADYPLSSMPVSCVSRFINLAAGPYLWEQDTVAPDGWLNLNLGAGTYTWKDCLYPGDPQDGWYTQVSELIAPDNEEAGSITYSFELRATPSGYTTTTWGSELIPGFGP